MFLWIYTVRLAEAADEGRILELYKQVAKALEGIAREEDEITPAYVCNNLQKAFTNAICLLIDHPDRNDALIAEVHCYKLEPRVFRHILSELTIVVHPYFQSKGLGKLLFTTLLHYIENNRSDILRVALKARESNRKAIEFYKKVGFVVEGRFEKRISNKDGSFEADIPMAWFNKNFQYDLT